MITYFKHLTPTLITMSLILSPVANAKTRTPFSIEVLKKVEKELWKVKDVNSLQAELIKKLPTRKSEFETFFKQQGISEKYKTPAVALKNGVFHLPDGFTITLYQKEAFVIGHKGREVELTPKQSMLEMTTKLESLTKPKTSALSNFIMSDAYAHPLLLVPAGVAVALGFMAFMNAQHEKEQAEIHTLWEDSAKADYADVVKKCETANQEISSNGSSSTYSIAEINRLVQFMEGLQMKNCLTSPLHPDMAKTCAYIKEVQKVCEKAVAANDEKASSVNESDRSIVDKADLPSKAPSSQSNRASGQ